eukprot:jgi/Botrbrau1/9399/Bobra.0252s0024.1
MQTDKTTALPQPSDANATRGGKRNAPSSPTGSDVIWGGGVPSLLWTPTASATSRPMLQGRGQSGEVQLIRARNPLSSIGSIGSALRKHRTSPQASKKPAGAFCLTSKPLRLKVI